MPDEWVNVFGGQLRVSRIVVSPEAFDELLERLDEPAKVLPRLQRLFEQTRRFKWAEEN